MGLDHPITDAYIKNEQQYYAPSGRVPYFDLAFERGEGAKLYDMDGNTYIDLLASASTANVGHSHPRVVEAISKQSEKLVHYIPAYFSNEWIYPLAKKLTDITPGDFEKKVLFGNSGSDANDGMIKYARAYTGRQNIIAFTDAYHGSTFGAISESSCSLNMRRKMGPFLPGIYHLPYPDMYRRLEGESDEALAERYLDNFRLAFRTYLPPEEVAGILVEPIQGDGGIRTAPKAFFDGLYDLCQEYGILFMVDEINQGLGRSGKWWSIEHFDIAPDLLATGKSLASGLPLSAIVGRKAIMDTLSAPAHAFTTSGNPVCAAASYATLQVIEEEHLIEKSAKDGEYVKERFNQWKDRFDFVGDVRVFGLNAGIELVTDKASKSKNPDAANKVIHYLSQHNVIMITLTGNVLRFQPPLVITREELDFALSQIEAAFIAYEKGEITYQANKHIGF